MVEGITSSAARAPRPVAPAAGAEPASGFRAPARSGPLPATPPPEVLADVEKAARALAELASRQVELHFSVDDANRVHVEVRDGDGRIVREIPASKAIDLLADSDGAVVDHYG